MNPVPNSHSPVLLLRWLTPKEKIVQGFLYIVADSLLSRVPTLQGNNLIRIGYKCFVGDELGYLTLGKVAHIQIVVSPVSDRYNVSFSVVDVVYFIKLFHCDSYSKDYFFVSRTCHYYLV